ncbi:hypothetical protein AAE478_007320 [Parahypoxylon ruwenzoriense]
MAEPLTRVDSAVQGLSTSPPKDKVNRVDSGVQDVSESPLEEKFARVESGVHDLSISPPKETITRVDSAVQGLFTSPPKEKVSHRRTSSSAAAVSSMKDMWETRTKLKVAPETQRTGWKINTSSSTVEEKDILKKPLVTPMVRAIELITDLGSVIVARNRQGVTIKDALDAIYKANKKRADDELDKAYLEGFEWAPEHTEYNEEDDGEGRAMELEWQRLVIHLSSTPGVSSVGGKKKKKAAAE